MDRFPKKPPFKVGTKLRYVGEDQTGYGCSNKCRNPEDRFEYAWTPVKAPGLEVVIAELRNGRQGTLRQCRDEDGPMYDEDSGDPILDNTSDGYSLYKLPCRICGREMFGPVIDHENKHEWTVVKS
jgi:hypothetical protein